jgi:uncharacterized cupin superfamily protein
MSPLTSEYREFALGARTFIHSGRRGRSATGSDFCIRASVGVVVPEASLERTKDGVRPVSEGWFVVNLRETRWFGNELGRYTVPEGEEARFEQIGVGLGVLLPGEPNAMYHAEDAQEDFLVLAGECVLIVEGEERRLKAWDFVHCPPMTEHVFVGAGGGPCVVVAVGARRKGRALVYPVNETALKYGAGVEEETSEPSVAYARFSEDVPVPCPEELRGP